MQPIPEITDRRVAIGGQLVITVPNVALVAQDGEQARFEVTAKDKAGRVSNAVVTDPITVHR